MTSRLPDPWEHASGYHLNGDGKAIKYAHPEGGAEIIVEAAADEEYGGLQYITFAFTEDRDPIEHPEIHDSKELAWETAAGWAEEHS